MKRISASLAVALLILPSAGFAERVSLTDMGISVWVPSGWELQNVGTTETSRTYLLDDTSTVLSSVTRRHSGAIYLQSQSGASGGMSPGSVAADSSTRQWVMNEGDVWSLIVSTAALGGYPYWDDTTLVSGLFAREVYGRSLDAVGDSVLTTFVRATANGDVGWDFWAQSDTSDADTAINTYVGLLDSIQVDLSVTVLPPTAIRVRSVRGPLSQALSSVGGALRIRAASQPVVEVMDLLGRSVPGTVVSAGDGIWIWKPRAERMGALLARVRADGAVLTRHLVLDP